MTDDIDTADRGKDTPHRDGMALGKSPVLSAVLIAFAIIGAVAFVGVFGMWAMHVGMMGGAGAC